jgi:hypothetical protein
MVEKQFMQCQHEFNWLSVILECIMEISPGAGCKETMPAMGGK